MMKFTITAPLGPFGDVDDADLRALKTALNHLGYYTPPSKSGISATRDSALFKALNAFQSDAGLLPSARIVPFDKTVYALDQALKSQNALQRYVWRSVGDEKVRSEHAARDGQIFLWGSPPEGGHPGEDFNCRCWAVPIPFAELHDGNPNADAINPALSPLDFLGGGLALRAGGTVLRSGSSAVTAALSRVLRGGLRDTNWIKNVPRSQLQKKFKHAKVFGIKGNENNKTLAQFKKALEDHVKSPDTRVIKGKLHKEDVTHYYNSRTNINVIRDKNGNFRSGGWDLSKEQVLNLLTTGKIGGN